jgi:peptide/nickel transport system permease protein
MRYVLRRLAHAVLVLAGVSLLSFLFTTLAPGDPFAELALDPRISPATVADLRARYGVDRPWPARYVRWLGSLARGELGYSIAYNAPVSSLLWPRVRNTLLLTVTATGLAWLIAVPAGAWTASRQGTWTDRLTAAATTAMLSVPELLVGLVLLMFAARTGYLPVGGMVSPRLADAGGWVHARDVATHLVLPLFALILLNLPVLVQHVRASLVDVLGAPFVQAARARGVPDRRLLFRDALRAAANPLIALLGLSVAGLLSMSLVIEALVSWPGLGPLLLDAIAARDLDLVIGAVMCSTALLLAANVIADGLLYVADPRVRPERA